MTGQWRNWANNKSKRDEGFGEVGNKAAGVSMVSRMVVVGVAAMEEAGAEVKARVDMEKKVKIDNKGEAEVNICLICQE